MVKPRHDGQGQGDEDRVGNQQEQYRLPLVQDQPRFTEEDQEDDAKHRQQRDRRKKRLQVLKTLLAQEVDQHDAREVAYRHRREQDGHNGQKHVAYRHWHLVLRCEQRHPERYGCYRQHETECNDGGRQSHIALCEPRVANGHARTWHYHHEQKAERQQRLVWKKEPGQCKPTSGAHRKLYRTESESPRTFLPACTSASSLRLIIIG